MEKRHINNNSEKGRSSRSLWGRSGEEYWSWIEQKREIKSRNWHSGKRKQEKAPLWGQRQVEREKEKREMITVTLMAAIEVEHCRCLHSFSLSLSLSLTLSLSLSLSLFLFQATLRTKGLSYFSHFHAFFTPTVSLLSLAGWLQLELAFSQSEALIFDWPNFSNSY